MGDPKSKTEWHLTHRKNKYGFLGVKWNERQKVFEAYINSPVKNKIYCGRGKTAEAAARKYDARAIDLFGADAVLNFKPQGEQDNGC